MVTNGGHGNAQSVFIRGDNANRTLVLVDGIRLGAATLGAISFVNIPLAQIERIEIVLGPVNSLCSTACLVQNLWLAARAEGQGVGWVSILKRDELRQALGIPARITAVAYLCLGYASHFLERPELEVAGWRSRMPLEDFVCFDEGGATESKGSVAVVERIREDQAREQAGTISWR